ncbi:MULTISPECIES: biotin-dependent carboxyltransferase family protein [Metabacillus]|uniref:KipI antagonist n=2 Tax=Metabacillus TaxID=2675233 RepID=A0A179TA81_9BACI|nr:MULTISPECIES: biotin-dependent carboxyltransferase family protein [Metabacillus]OAS89322.1 KipI antagonist [Metabacillus litoralis]QNF28836.1 biotin-dependent carboxyltransferase [Metabacillus sp. KUDC1714]
MTIKVLEQGLSTTVQDLGRIGFQQYGVVVGGVMDEVAAKIANLLIGNNEDDAVVEMTLIGPTLLFQQDTLISLCGADLSASIGSKPVPLWKPIFVKAGSVLRFGRPLQGCRTYLAVAGGIDVPLVMESRSTYVRGGLGGYHGRTLQKGDVLNYKPSDLAKFLCTRIWSGPFKQVNWTVSSLIKPVYKKDPEIRFIKGPQFDLFIERSKREFLSEKYKVTPNSDRMGYRLSAKALKLTKDVELLSEAVTMGTIQVPNDGQPIILMADRQTIGGYPKIGYVASIDFSVLSQVMPGENLTFKEISIQDAQRLLLEREHMISKVKIGISLAFRRMKHGSY